MSLISLDPDLKPEYSHSISGSVDLYHRFGSWDTNLTVEGFYTRLNDVFALVENGHDQQGNPPDNYGYFLATLTPVHDFSIAINGKITGSMLVQHYAGYLYLRPCAPPYLVPGAEPKALRRVS